MRSRFYLPCAAQAADGEGSAGPLPNADERFSARGFSPIIDRLRLAFQTSKVKPFLSAD
jgi:hypothetical protein